MADFCRFFMAAGEVGSHVTVDRLRVLLSQERESFRVCLQTLSHLLGLKLNELINFDRSQVMKDDVVSIYLSGELPESVIGLLDDVDATPARRHALALQVGKLLKARLRYGLNDVVQALDGAPAKDLYSRSIACLLRITMCALKVECNVRRSNVVDVGKYMLDESGASLCEVLSRCSVMLCIFAAEESNLFDSVKEVQETLLGLVPGPLMLHIIGAFPVIAFDNECLFSLQNRRVFVESLSSILPDLLDHILIFNRMGVPGSSRKRDVRKNMMEVGKPSSVHVSCEGSSGASTTLEDVVSDEHNCNLKNDIHIDRTADGKLIDDNMLVVTPIDSSDWEFAFGNVPRVRTLSLLLEFIIKFSRVDSDGTVNKHTLGWLDTLVSKPSFLQTFAPIFSTGDTSNFGRVLELSRMLRRDVFVSHHILVIGNYSDQVLGMTLEAGIDILTADDTYAPRILSFLVEGIEHRPREVIECWCSLLTPLVLYSAGDNGVRFADGVAATQVLRVAENLFDSVSSHALMQNFGDECHPDEDNVNACTARQLMVLLTDIMGNKRVSELLSTAINAAHEAIQQEISLESVQTLEFAVFCLWLIRMPDNASSQKDVFSYVHQVNERTLQTTIQIYEMARAYEGPKRRVDALEKIKKGIRASRLRNMVDNSEPWFEDQQINAVTKEDWEVYYRDFADCIKDQLTNAVLHRMPDMLPDGSHSSTGQPSIPRHSKGGRKLRRGFRKGTPCNKQGEPLITPLEYTRRAKLLMRIYKLMGIEGISDDICATILSVMAHSTLPFDECRSVFDLLLERCSPEILHKVHESGQYNLILAMFKSMSSNLDPRFIRLLPEMMNTAVSRCEFDGDTRGLLGLMEVLTSAVAAHYPLADLMEVINAVAILQRFVVFVNCIAVDSSEFLEVRGRMNMTLIERYVKLGTARMGVHIEQHVHDQLKQIMLSHAAEFRISLNNGTVGQPAAYAARGELNTLDMLVFSTFQIFFTRSTTRNIDINTREGGLSDVFHWNLLGREYAIAFKTVSLVFSCFSQLSNTKLMFIFEHFVGLAARINSDAHSTARRKMLTDDCLLKPEAIEYLYQVHCQLSKSSTTVRIALS
ncbi:uncharacterized protein BBOV_IV006470 [Babesia bovis T2Bo]|uniref:Uncharacterized protein n=1 Tax=Babesia bovis TaxID=5865 RepID=A7AR37_BABBO|nr:uncharacterized protein BBOV_IV006470 [Babesia bovis T2Bo]EDO07006.1 hypothetical protein BBOV_IV006470 [Babesia bovis T2Bo]|eukprot:XP_001610574.1 hypothetical protein [Babesia bovis T2Bo]